jgi:hypothetical protein
MPLNKTQINKDIGHINIIKRNAESSGYSASWSQLTQIFRFTQFSNGTYISRIFSKIEPVILHAEHK